MDKAYTSERYRVLIVEDDLTAQSLLQSVITRVYPHFEVHVAPDGHQGLALFEAIGADVIITDLSMPNMNGMEMAREIRKLTPHPEIIVITACNDISSIITCINIGISNYVLKPIDLNRILEAIKVSVGRIDMGRELAARNNSLRESEERYHALFNSLQDGVSLLEMVMAGSRAEFRIMDVNPSFEQMAGESRNSLIGRSITEVVPDLDGRFLRHLTDVVVSRSPASVDHFCKSWDRTFRMQLYSPLQGQVAIVYADITQHQKLQEEREKNERLNSLGVLAGGIAHDFNNILTAIAGNISLARHRVQKGEDPTPRLMESERALVKASGLTRQLLTFARGGEPIRKPLASQSLIREAVSLFLSGTNCVASIKLADDLWNLYADAGQIQQTLNNLILNAVQAMPGGGVITVTASNARLSQDAGTELTGGRYVRITVSDEGEGIPPDLLPRIFDPYVTTKAGGNGLGLSSVHSIVRRHGGSVTVSSEGGVGTTFELLLPAADEHLQEEHPPKEAAVSVQGGKEILVMDDEEVVRNVAAGMLKALGYAVIECCNGSEAVERYRERLEQGTPFAAVLLDMTVPGGMGGKEAALQLRSMHPDATLIIVSGYFAESLTDLNREAMVDGLVAKPFNISQLGEELSRALRGKGRKGAALPAV